MIRKLRQNPTPSNSANKRTRRPVLNDAAVCRTDDEGDYVRVSTGDLVDGPVLLAAWDGTPGKAENERPVYKMLAAEAHQYLHDSEHNPHRATALDLPDEAA